MVSRKALCKPDECVRRPRNSKRMRVTAGEFSYERFELVSAVRFGVVSCILISAGVPLFFCRTEGRLRVFAVESGNVFQ